MTPLQKHGLLKLRLQCNDIGWVISIDHIRLEAAEETIISYVTQSIGANDPYEIKIHFVTEPARKDIEIVAIQIDNIYLEAGQLDRVRREALRHNPKLWKRIESGRGVAWRTPHTLKELQES